MWSGLVTCAVFFVLVDPSFGRDLKCAKSKTCMSTEKCKARHNGNLPQPSYRCNNAHHERICCPSAIGGLPLSNHQDFATTSSTADIKSHENFRLLPDLTKCGHRNATKRFSNDEFEHNKVIEGKVAKRGDHPWMVLITLQLCPTGVSDFCDKQKKKKLKCESSRCGGTLISKRYVLTAAHCMFDGCGRQYEVKPVHLGEYNITENCTDVSGRLCRQKVEVDRVIVHEEYSQVTKMNDIALLRLKRDVLPNDNENIAPICLPFEPLSGASGSAKLKLTGGRFIVAGWGLTDWSKKEKPSQVLRVAEFKNSGGCSIKCDANNETPGCRRDLTLCIEAYGRQDTCKGDSGGPIMIQTGEQWVQVGVTSFKAGEQCGQQGLPSFYTRLDSYLNWILNNIDP